MSDDAPDALRRELAKLELLYEVGIALSTEHNTDRLLERILVEAKDLCGADGGSLYLRTEDDHLRFAIVRNDSLKLARGGTTGRPIEFTPIPLYDEDGQPNHKNVATHAALVGHSVNVPDAYDTTRFDFSGTKAFDAASGYRSMSFLTIPMVNHKRNVIGVLQLLNAKEGDAVVPFAPGKQRIVEALASQAAVALENQQLIDGQKQLLESFIQMIAAAIDSKSPYTGGHCERVPILTLMLAEAACAQSEGPFADFTLNDDEWYELKIAAWLHDCGKVTTPVHIMDKATKLETIHDRIWTVEARMEVLKREARIAMLEARLAGEEETHCQRRYEETIATLDEEMALLRRANVGAEFLSPEMADAIRRIGARRYVEGGAERTLLTDEELDNLLVGRGTLTNEERLIINGHMVQTIQMLEALPFPANLRRVPEYAGGHHEKLDGTGYPRGLYAGDMSIPARIMAIADVFEALTAQDRPYKKGKSLSESMRIMGFMKRDNHLDAALLDLFVKTGVYRDYAARYLPDALIDKVDEEAILAIEPKAFDLPDREDRDKRHGEFLPEYQRLRSSAMGHEPKLSEPG